MIRHKVKIYHSRVHLIVTFLLVFLPFIALALFSRFTHIALRELFKDMSASIGRLVIAYVLAVAFAWLAAVSFYKGRRSAVMLPLFDVLQSLPSSALLPLAVIIWGATNFTVITFLFLAIVWPVFFSIISSLKLIRRDWEEAAQIYNLTGYNYIRHFLLPVSIPGLVTGSIIGLGEGWEAMVATEIIVSIRNGVGSFFLSFSSDLSLTLLGVTALLALVFSINKLVWLPLLDWSHKRIGE